jgi:glycosyltransferase involved in cell wall biosynthesis
LPQNAGMAGALRDGFLFVLYLLRKKWVREDDILVTIDADGQHKPEYISKIIPYMARKGVDIVLARRDFSAYPLYKILGNRFLTWTNSALSGKAYDDVESGLRFLKVKTLRTILRYYTGVKYSCAQEIALLSAKAGFKIDNDYQVSIAYYRPGTTLLDGFIVLALSLFSFFRWTFGFSSEVSDESPFMREAFGRSKSLWPKRKVKNPSGKR